MVSFEDLNFNKDIVEFLAPGAKIISYNKKNLNGLLNGKRIFVAGPGFETEEELKSCPGYGKIIEGIAQELVKHSNVTLITGCCANYSISSLIAKKIKEINPEYPIVGVSKYGDLPDKEKYSSISEIHDIVIYCGHDLRNIPKNLKFASQDLINVAIADCVLAIGGSVGTNHEISIAYELGKSVGLITGLGGVADVHSEILEAIRKEGRKKINVKSNSDPAKIIKFLLE